MERQATQPAAVPSGRKRRRVSTKKPKGDEEAQAQALDLKATQPATSELVLALNAIPQMDSTLPPPTPSPTQPVQAWINGPLKDYEEECVEEGTFHADPAKEVGEWEIVDQDATDLDQMDTQLNQLLYEACPFHPHQFIHCVNPQTEFGQLRFKCPQEGCPVYLFEDTREVMMEKLKEDTHPQVRARLQRGELRCKCGWVPKMKLSRTAKNYNKVFFSCGSFLPGQEPCGYFQWLHGPLWCPRERAQPTLRRWVKDTPPEVQQSRPWMKVEKVPVGRWSNGYVPVPLLKKHCLDTGKDDHIDGPLPREWLYGNTPSFVSESQLAEARRKESNRQWLNQFAESAKAQEREFETRRHLHKNFGSSSLF